MQIERQRRLHDDHMSGNWSFGSNYQPYSQTRKMSIGIVVDSSAKTKSKIGSEVAAAELHSSQNVKSVKDVPAESKRNGKEGTSSDLGRQNKPPRKESSPLIRRITSDQNTASQMLNQRARDANEKKSKSNFNQREGGNHGIIGREEESAYATPKKLLEPEKGTTEQGTSEKVNSGNILRMKVQELLGTVISSPNKTQHNSQTFGMDVDKTKQQSKTTENDTPAAAHKHNFHTREANSGSLSLNTRKPVTRSASGKKPQAQKSLPKNQSPLCQSKQAHVDENAFSFVETCSKRSNTDVSPGFKTFKRKEREELETRPVKTSVMEE
nr:meiosis-specific protein ASY3 [Tanacetum cinerariifolium]